MLGTDKVLMVKFSAGCWGIKTLFVDFNLSSTTQPNTQRKPYYLIHFIFNTSDLPRIYKVIRLTNSIGTGLLLRFIVMIKFFSVHIFCSNFNHDNLINLFPDDNGANLKNCGRVPTTDMIFIGYLKLC